MPLRIVFCGTPAFALPTLAYLVAEPGFQIVGVVTQPDRPRGRGNEIFVSPVKSAALEAGIPVYQPEKVKTDEAQDYFERLEPDVVAIIAYGQIIPSRLIALPRLGWINLHGSLLPKYRGAAPIHRAILHGEEKTGLTTMQINAGLDTGPMLLQYETQIGPDESAPELMARLAIAGAPLMAETISKMDSREIVPIPQDESLKSFAPPLKKEEGRIDWSLSALEIYNRVRGLQPWPGAFTTFRGKICNIWGKPASEATSVAIGQPGHLIVRGTDLRVVCGRDTMLSLQFVQLAGRKKLTAREFVNGARLMPGDNFGD